ncbi:MAG TPA: dUTP diphosphatase [Desulfobacteraceae bacterium]|nr:dUTP diphosphatase [Desulfobacteraceae bacterium]
MVTVKLLPLKPEHDADLPLPQPMTSKSAGMDICAAVKDKFILKQGEVSLIPTGFAMALPDGYEAQIRPRSGLAVKHGVTVINSPGTIDSDYRGEVMIGLINLGKSDYIIHRGDRIAQMVIKKVLSVTVVTVSKLDKTERDSGGFGHTGL